MGKAWTLISSAARALALGVVLFLLFEGIASLADVLYVAHHRQPWAEETFIQYDAQLGWVAKPNCLVENAYGRGVGVQTNHKGFRGDREYPARVPDGKTRIVCSGDSFTFGWGVRDADTWVSQLSERDPSVETVNLGQGGYGIDQAYLWYMRDGLPLDHDMHILAVIMDDFRRIGQSSFIGYDKPVLTVSGESLIVYRSPARRRVTPRSFTGRLREAGAALASVRVARRVLGLSTAQSREAIDLPQVERVFRAIVRDLHETNLRKKSRLLLVFLPTERDYLSDTSAIWRVMADETARQHGIPYLDLVTAIRRLPPLAVKPLFIQPGEYGELRFAEGHLTVAGNTFVADRIHEWIQRIR